MERHLRLYFQEIVKIFVIFSIYSCVSSSTKATEIEKPTSSGYVSQKSSSLISNSIPTLYYFSAPGCPACYEMDPVIGKAEAHYKNKLKIVKFDRTTKKRLQLLRKYNNNVDVRYVPFVVLADDNDRLLAYSKGYTPSEILYKNIDEGFEKLRRLPELKMSKIMFICHYSYEICPKLEKELKEWINSKETPKIELTTIDIEKLQSPETMKSFNLRLENMKYLYGLDHIPAVIGLTEENEVLGVLQTIFSINTLELEFNGFY